MNTKIRCAILSAILVFGGVVVAAAANVKITDPTDGQHLPGAGQMGYKVYATYKDCGPQAVSFLGSDGGGMYATLSVTTEFHSTANPGEYWSPLDLADNISYTDFYVRASGVASMVGTFEDNNRIYFGP